MADSASTLEAQQRRAFDANTFAQQQARNPDPSEYIRRQASGLGSGLDSLQGSGSPSTSAAAGQLRNIAQEQAAENQPSGGPLARLRQIGEMRKKAATAAVSGEALAKLNTAYTRVFNTFQSELIGNALALEIVISPWLFLGLFFMRIMAGLIPLRVKGIIIFPKYSLGLAGIGVFISHLTAALVILTILTLIFTLIAFIVWIITEDPITQSQVFLDLSTGALKGLWDLFAGS